MTVWTIVVAAGGGRRFGAAKQFAALGDRRVVDHAVARATEASDAVVVVLPDGVAWVGEPVAAAVAGGPTRAGSTRAGLAVVPETADVVVVHDAARPLAGPQLFEAVIAAVVGGADAAVPALPVTDTLKRVHDDRVVGTVAREGLVAVQTPQAFRSGVLRAAHAEGREGTDDAALVERAGGRVVIVRGDPRNAKITDRADLAVASALLADAAARG